MDERDKATENNANPNEKAKYNSFLKRISFFLYDQKEKGKYISIDVTASSPNKRFNKPITEAEVGERNWMDLEYRARIDGNKSIIITGQYKQKNDGTWNKVGKTTVSSFVTGKEGMNLDNPKIDLECPNYLRQYIGMEPPYNINTLEGKAFDAILTERNKQFFKWNDRKNE